MDFIFMLTRGDQTVQDRLRVLDDIASVEIAHIGFKDVGVDTDTLRALNRSARLPGHRGRPSGAGASGA
jgi:hypothetical protein